MEKIKKNKRPGSKALLITLIVVISVLVVGATAVIGLYYYKKSGFKGTSGQCTWSLDESGVLMISGSGSLEKELKVTRGLGEPALDSVTEIVFGEGVTSIPESFTADMPNVTKVTIPSTVSTIGLYNFTELKNLSEITVSPENLVYTSENGDLYDKNMTELIAYASGKPDIEYALPEGVSKIDINAFKYSANLVKIDLNIAFTVLEDFAFVNCDALSEITVPEENGVFRSVDGDLYNFAENRLFRYCPGKADSVYQMPETVKRVEAGAFQGAANLTDITLSSHLTRIGIAGFYGCSGLTSIELPETVEYVCESAFAQCSSLTAVSLPAQQTIIPKDIFRGCTSLQYVELSDGITEIGSGAFSCSGIQTVIIPDSVRTVGDNAFGGCASLESVYLPAGITQIGDYTFNKCSVLKEITIPESVTSIGYSAFRGCIALNTVAVPDSVTAIGDYAFYGCTGLASANIGSGVGSVGSGVFYGCDALTGIAYNGTAEKWASVTVGTDNKVLTDKLSFK